MYAPLLTRVKADNGENVLTGHICQSYALQVRVPSARHLAEFRADVLPNLYYVIGESWGPAVQLFETELEVLLDPAKDGL